MAKVFRSTRGYERDDAFIPAHYQPALLVDLALSRGINTYELFKNTRLKLDEFQSARKQLSPEQFLALIANSQKLLQLDDISFLYGQMLYPGCYGACSHALHQLTNCRQVIEYICQFHAILSPLLTPRFYENEHYLFLYWQDSSGAGNGLRFLVESSMVAVKSLINWLSGEKLAWQYHFSYAEPSYIEQYWVNFGHQLCFQQQKNMLIIPKLHVNKEWAKGGPIGLQASLNASRVQLHDLTMNKSFLDQVYDYLTLNIRQPMNLDKLSDAFYLSPASMKRKLKKHNTHFQEQIDLVRKYTAIRLFYSYNYSHQQIADYLQFNDMNNFRRSFKRWTGFSPANIFTELSI